MKTSEKTFDEFEELVLELDMARILFAKEEEEEEARIVVSIKDITERKRTEEALRWAEENFRRSLDESPLGVRIVTIEGETVYANRAMLNIYGYDSIEELRTTPLKERYTPESYAEFQIRMEKRRQGDHDPSEYEVNIVRKNGEVRQLQVFRKEVLWDGEPQFQVIYQDITECKRAEEALRESETRYRLLAENATDVIYTVGMDMRLTYVSPSVTRLLGFTVEEAMARTMRQAYTPEAFEKAMQIFAEEMAIESAGHGDPTRSRMLELELVRKDGNTVPAEGNFCALRDPTGKMIGILAILRDITERKRAEEELRDSENRYRELSIVDDLTQLYNSRYFYHQLKMEMDRTERYGQPLTLLLLDLDDFKTFNDAYGHVEGDKVLLRLGQVVKRCLRQTDSGYRYGGEEFTVLLPMTTDADGAVTAERIRTEFKKENFSPAPGQDVHVTVSIGLAQYKPQEEMKVFVHRVDQLMYQGKKNGKDRVCCES